ncbi:hypothetical protein [Botrimarina mediterranea]|uniref:Uncharacterized protein n=1 Tax=Botrimarina mediterranea TaxID=2528022 RepID=A0A518K5Y1_9BACT|nr:hypothetical protein [Botrimarina mediterranea]QDV73204.1 hypothetical protein Spa11_14000 [Botrimarina mediterranea]
MAKKKVTEKSAAKAVNKSELVREHAAANPKEKPKAIAEGIKKKHGVEISPQQISTVLFQARAKAGKKKAKKRAPAASGSETKVSLSLLLDAKQFAEKVGGVDQATMLLAALKKLD